MNSAAHLLIAAEIEDKVKGHSRAGFHRELRPGMGTDEDGRVVAVSMPPSEEQEEVTALRVSQEKMAETLRQWDEWTLEISPLSPDPLRAIGLRNVARTWVVNPGSFGDDPSLRQTCKKFGVSPARLSQLTAEFSRRFGITNQFGSHDWRRKENHHAN